MALFNPAVTWLHKNRVLLSSISVLARQVSEACTVAERRLYASVARAAHKADRTLAPALVGCWRCVGIHQLRRVRRLVAG
ncbi:hypothetical protein [Streptomyces griseocarneus]|uniref:hypothetical protein n=1 Tax=Streptomyces griseocarneus TaxID=51201 RepID=UPI00167D342E|nr:hypothetical protein [Streptomyces griseocarneus]MBZ6474994.1 hypothetical protein [Streptomyces griseocarneus]GHG62923.1 hypothetical protein GCM10018779_32050 [Streptomyces griseocarneus]